MVPFWAGAQAPACDDISWNTGQVSLLDIASRLGASCTDDIIPPPTECADGLDNDGDGLIDSLDPGCSDGTELPDNTPPPAGGNLSFTRVETPSHGPTVSGWFSAFVWQGKVGLLDHSTGGGNDPIWSYNGSFAYDGQLSTPAGPRAGRTITLPSGTWPVSGRGVQGSGNPDILHINGQSHYLCDSKWGSEECQGWGDVNGDGYDDVLVSNGTVLDGASLVTLPNEGAPSGTVIGQNIQLFRSSWWTKAVCMWQDRVLTDQGLFNLQGNLIASIPSVPSPEGPDIKGGFACGDFDDDGDIDVTYTSGGPDDAAGGVRYLLRNDGDSFTDVGLGGLPATGGVLRRWSYSLSEDLNNDGCNDLVLTDHGEIYESNCDMTFTFVQSIHVSDRMPGASIGDIDGDGLKDVCVTPDKADTFAICYFNDTSTDVVVTDPTGDPDDPKPLSRATDAAALEQFYNWYAALPYDHFGTWMYDRVGTLYELWERTGEESVKKEARRSALEYVKHYQVDGSGNGGWPNCDGGWAHAGVNKCDSKMTYLSALHYLQKHESIAADPQLVATLGEYQWRMGWGVGWTSDPWSKITERDMGYSLMGIQYACRMGHQTSCERIPVIIGHLSALEVDGWFLHSYNGHEKTGEPGAAGDALVASPWMSAILIDALIRADAIVPDDRVKGLVERHAQAQLAELQLNHQTHHSYNGTNYLPWYLFFPGDEARTEAVQYNDGWHSDMHIPEVTRTIEAGGLTVPYDITNFYTRDMIDQVLSPSRMFAWQH